MPEEKHDIVLAFLGPFPSGVAAANHVRRICRGLQLEGWNPLLISVGAVRKENDTIAEGIDTKWGLRFRCENVRLYRGPLNIIAYARMAGTLLDSMFREELARHPIKAVLLYGSSYFAFNRMLRTCKSKNIPAFTYEVEYPLWSCWQRLLTGAYFDHWMHVRKSLRHMAGMIGISSFWRSVADDSGVPFEVIPSYLPEELSSLHHAPEAHAKKNSEGFHLVSIGRWEARERVSTILLGIKKAHNAGVPIHYTAIGVVGGDFASAHALRKCKSDPVLKKIVKVVGWLNESDKMNVLKSADAFVLLRRDTIETAALFPTRLPEYLATGRPLLASSAGDIPMYLEHERSAFLLPADDTGDFLSLALIRLHRDTALAYSVGRGGFNAAVEHFSIEANGVKMNAFLNQLLR